jgi:hypothetical protein
MAKAGLNILFNNTFGRLGGFYTRVVNKITIISKRPDFSERVLSEKQVESNNRFRDATVWAHKAEKDPELWDFYKKRRKRNQTIQNVAVSDFMCLPVIEKIDPGSYEGKPGGVIIVNARDKYRVAAVSVSIVDSKGEEIEHGSAVAHSFQFPEWGYVTKEPNLSKSLRTLSIFSFSRSLILPRSSFLFCLVFLSASRSCFSQ